MKLIDIATAAQKYCFASTEEWALSSLVDLVKMSNQLNERQVRSKPERATRFRVGGRAEN